MRLTIYKGKNRPDAFNAPAISLRLLHPESNTLTREGGLFLWLTLLGAATRRSSSLGIQFPENPRVRAKIEMIQQGTAVTLSNF